MTLTQHRANGSRWTQKERVAELLLDMTKVCSTYFYDPDVMLPTGRNRVGELRRDDGWLIETEKCDIPTHHHDTYQVMYRKVFDPDKCLCPVCPGLLDLERGEQGSLI